MGWSIRFASSILAKLAHFGFFKGVSSVVGIETRLDLNINTQEGVIMVDFPLSTGSLAPRIVETIT